MGLVLTVKQGESVLIGNAKVKVTRIRGPQRFDLEVDAGPMMSVVTIDGMAPVQVMKNVHISAGENTQRTAIKMFITAPQNVNIVREKLLGKDATE